MNRTWRFVRRLFGANLRRWLLLEAKNLHFQIVGVILRAVVLSLIAIGLNFVGLKEINLLLAIFVSIIVSIYASRPIVLLSIFGIGAGLKQNSLSPAKATNNAIAGGKEALEYTAKLFIKVMLYYSLFLTVAGLFPFRNNWKAVPVLLAAVTVLFWIDRAEWFHTRYQRKLIYGFLVGAVIFELLTLIPRANYQRVLGFYPLAFTETTPLEQEAENADLLIRKAQHAPKMERFKGIKDRINHDEQVTQEDIDFLKQTEAEIKSDSLTGKFSQATGKVVSALTPNAEASVPPKAQQTSTIRVYPPSIKPYEFHVKAGERLDHVVSFPDGYTVTARIDEALGSEYKIVFADGRVYGQNDPLPRMQGAKFWFEAITDSDIFMKVEKQ